MNNSMKCLRASTGFSTWDGCNPDYMYKRGAERLESCPSERNSRLMASWSQQSALAAKRAAWSSIRHSIASQEREGIVLLCAGAASPQEYSFGHHNIRTSNYLSASSGGQQRLWKVLRAKTWGVAVVIWFVQLGGQKAEEWPHPIIHLPQGRQQSRESWSSSVVTSDSTWGNRMKLHQGKLRQYISKNCLSLFTVWALKRT